MHLMKDIMLAEDKQEQVWYLEMEQQSGFHWHLTAMDLWMLMIQYHRYYGANNSSYCKDMNDTCINIPM